MKYWEMKTGLNGIVLVSENNKLQTWIRPIIHINWLNFHLFLHIYKRQTHTHIYHLEIYFLCFKDCGLWIFGFFKQDFHILSPHIFSFPAEHRSKRELFCIQWEYSIFHPRILTNLTSSSVDKTEWNADNINLLI